MKGVRIDPDRDVADDLVANAIADQTAELTEGELFVSVWLHRIERPSGPRSFVRLVVTEQIPDHGHSVHPINLEPEQARRLAEQLEHGADLADREPVGIVRDLVEGLRTAGVPDARIKRALGWLARHEPETGK